MKIQPKQVKIIKIAQKQLGMDDAAYRELLAHYGAQSCTELSAEQAERMIDEMVRKGFRVVTEKKKRTWLPGGTREGRPQGAPRSGGKVVRLATAAELAKLSAVAGLIAWRAEGGLALFLEKRLSIKGGKVRTAREAYLAIEALKKMFENQMKAAHGKGWWDMAHADARVMEYIAVHRPACTGEIYGRES